MLETLASATMAALTCRRGAAMVEYALLAALIAMVAIVSLRTIGTNVSSKFTSVVNTL